FDVDRAWRGPLGRDLMDWRLDDDRRGDHARRGLVSGRGRRGRGWRRLSGVRRCGGEHLCPRVRNRLLARCRLIFVSHAGSLPHGVTMRLPVRRGPRLGPLVPAFAVTIEAIEPVPAGRRRTAGLRQARLFDGSWRGGGGGFLGRGGEQVFQGVRLRRRSRKTRCKEKKSRNAKAPMAGHGNSGVAPHNLSRTIEPDQGHNATSIRQPLEFIRAVAPIVPRRIAWNHCMLAAIFSADISTGKFVLAHGTTGKIEASTTRKPWTPLTRPS